MTNWHWVRTHSLSTYADNAGHVTFNDVLGSWKHNIHVFADPSHQRPVSISNVRAYDNGRAIPFTRVNAHVFTVELGTRIQNHVTLKITSNCRAGPVYATVWQYQRVVQSHARPQPQRQMRPRLHTMPNGEACLCDQCSAMVQRTQGYQTGRTDEECIIA